MGTGTIASVGVFTLAVAALAMPAMSAPVPPPEWAIEKIDGMTCVAGGPNDGQAQLTLAAIGPQFLMLISSPDFPQASSTQPATLVFDDHSPVYSPASGDHGVLQIRLGRGEPAQDVIRSSRVTITLRGHVLHFPLVHSSAALDAVARCAGQPTLAEAAQKPDLPIPGAGGWALQMTLPGIPGRACHARLAGNQMDTILALNNEGKLILIGGHSDWSIGTGERPFELSIDGGPRIAMKASLLDNIFLSPVLDDKLTERLSHAKRLDWYLPTGELHIDVTGIGITLEAMRRCKAST